MAPKTVDTGEQSVGGPRYMRSIVSLDDSGSMQVRTHTFVHIDLSGFTGGVLVSLADINGNVLWVSPLVQYGVDGRWVFWSESDRWDNEYYNVGPDIAVAADRMDVWVGWAPKNRFWKDLEILTVVIEVVKWVIENWPGSDGEGGSGVDPPVQTTQQGLTAVRGDLVTHVDPDTIPYAQPTALTVKATDSRSGADVSGVVYKSMSVPLNRAGTPIGNVGNSITATLTGKWITQKRVVIEPETGEKYVVVTRKFVQERLYVRTGDYGDVLIPFTLSGAPTDPEEV